jgi:hypothetical protein
MMEGKHCLPKGGESALALEWPLAWIEAQVYASGARYQIALVSIGHILGIAQLAMCHWIQIVLP